MITILLCYRENGDDDDVVVVYRHEKKVFLLFSLKLHVRLTEATVILE